MLLVSLFDCKNTVYLPPNGFGRLWTYLECLAVSCEDVVDVSARELDWKCVVCVLTGCWASRVRLCCCHNQSQRADTRLLDWHCTADYRLDDTQHLMKSSRSTEQVVLLHCEMSPTTICSHQHTATTSRDDDPSSLKPNIEIVILCWLSINLISSVAV